MTDHLDMLGLMDKAVGSLMEIIEEKNLEQDTIFIFASDNGGLVFSDETGAGHRASGPLRGTAWRKKRYLRWRTQGAPLD